MPEHIDWMLWRPVIAKIVSRTELKTTLSIIDLLDANDALDLEQEAERLANERKG